MAGHLTAEERDRMARLWHQQADQKEIARSRGAFAFDDQPRVAA